MLSDRPSNVFNRSTAAPQLRLLLVAMLLFLCAASASRADITIKFDDLKDGDKISDTTVVVVRADSGDGIDKVEFAVDDQLRFSTGSTPYTFKWDTLADPEGMHNLAVTAIDANGTKKTVMLSVMIDNELAQGAPALAQKARDALAMKDMETAVKFSRRALKADPDNVDGARSLAAVLAERQNWDKAVGTLEKAKNLNESAPAMLELASYRMHRALLPENAANLVTDIDTVTQLRRKAAQLNIDRVKAAAASADGPAAHLSLGDAYIQAGRYHDAIEEYNKATSDRSLPAINRLALAFVLNDQPNEALINLRPFLKDNAGDAATRAVSGLAMLRLHRFADARQQVSGDIGGGNPASLTIAAFADSALGRADKAAKEARDAADALPSAGEAHWALSNALPKPIDAEPELIKAISLSPFQSGPLLDYAARYTVLKSNPDRVATGMKLVDLVMKSEPANVNGKIMRVLFFFHTNRVKEAEPLLNELLKAEPKSADIQVLAAMYFNLTNRPTEVDHRLELARSLDSQNFDLTLMPKPLGFMYTLVYRLHYRGGFYLMPGTLYPPKPAPSAAP